MWWSTKYFNGTILKVKSFIQHILSVLCDKIEQCCTIEHDYVNYAVRRLYTNFITKNAQFFSEVKLTITPFCVVDQLISRVYKSWKLCFTKARWLAVHGAFKFTCLKIVLGSCCSSFSFLPNLPFNQCLEHGCLKIETVFIVVLCICLRCIADNL